jgi:hypothetical protein
MANDRSRYAKGQRFSIPSITQRRDRKRLIRNQPAWLQEPDRRGERESHHMGQWETVKDSVPWPALSSASPAQLSARDHALTEVPAGQ